MMTPKASVMSVLRGEIPEKTPFTMYECMIPQCSVERELRNRGMCIVKRIRTYRIERPNVNEKAIEYTDKNGRRLKRIIYSTEGGELTELTEQGNNTIWKHEYMFKGPEDYKALYAFISDGRVIPDYESAAKLAGMLGDDFAVRDQICLEPLQALISEYMGTETFCYEWMDNRDEVLKLYDALTETARKIYPVVADGPLEFANYGGNVVPDIVGRENFENYFMPHYEEAAVVLHKKNKLIGCHFDADNSTIMDLIGRTPLDYIEAFDPGFGPSAADAGRAWPEKVLWINWPSAWQLYSEEEVYNRTIEMLRQAAPGNNFIIGITEDIPEGLWQRNCLKIMDAVDGYYSR